MAASSRALCPACGAETAPGQEYCPECGERLNAPQVVATEVIRRRFPLVGESWFLPSFVALLVATISSAMAIHYVDKPDRSRTFVATAANTFVITRVTTAPTLTQAAAGTTPVAATTAPRQTTIQPWPANRSSGWTVVLVSLPRAGGRPQALAIARRALADGLDDVGIIDSARFASLHPGYLVVFSGVYDTQSAARQALESAHTQGFAAAYVRDVSR